MATTAVTKETIISNKINTDSKYLASLFRQSSDRNQERYKPVMQETLPLKEEKIVLIPTRLRELLASILFVLFTSFKTWNFYIQFP